MNKEFMIWELTELFATICNILSNFVMMVCMCRDKDHKVPSCVIGIQISANAAWIMSSILKHDPYLCITAACSLTLQCATIYLLKTNHSKHNLSNFDESVDELPQLTLKE